MVVRSEDSRSRGFCLIIDDRHNAYGKAVKVILGALEVGHIKNNVFIVLIIFMVSFVESRNDLCWLYSKVRRRFPCQVCTLYSRKNSVSRSERIKKVFRLRFANCYLVFHADTLTRTMNECSYAHVSSICLRLFPLFQL